MRTAFSTAAREAGDISAGVFDMKGRTLAQAVTGTPGHINSMARSVVHFLDAFPAATLKDGDILITNDPWKGTGHLFDLTVVTPIFLDGRAVALFASTTHVVDIGGLGVSAEGRQIYHEGLYIPLMYLAREGQMNENLLGMVRANVREPVQVVGDIYALIACNEKGGTRLVEMMREFTLRVLELLGSGTSLKVKGFQVVPPGDRLIVEMPGGGGYGDPFTRDPAQVARDVRYGLIEPEQAEAAYGVILNAAGELDAVVTERRRAAQ